MKNIFIVDDNDANLFAAQEVLQKHYNVFTLPSAAAMFDLLEDIIPELILIDIKMPEMSGFEAVEKLKEDSRYALIPVIFLTGLNDVETEAHGFEMGAVDFIPKPFSEPSLLSRVKTHIEIETLVRERTQHLQNEIDMLRGKIAQLEAAD